MSQVNPRDIDTVIRATIRMVDLDQLSEQQAHDLNMALIRRAGRNLRDAFSALDDRPEPFNHFPPGVYDSRPWNKDR